jgi:asparagine synthetase B (glutamine-hydrolysing)
VNVTLGVFARRPEHVAGMRRLATAAIDHVHSVFPDAVAEHRRHDSARAVVYNSNQSRAWRVGTWYEGPDSVLSLSAPPIPLDGPVDVTRYSEKIWTATADPSSLASFLPNYMGIRVDGDRFSAWSDLLGLGRCYVVENRSYVAVSNHIGALVPFLDAPPTADEECWRQYAVFGWFVGDRTGIRGIRRVDPAVMITSKGRSARSKPYGDYRSLAGARQNTIDPSEVVEQLRTVTRNTSSIVTARPRVMLSGGRDSRLTAAVWLSAGNPALVRTVGTLAREADVARQLIAALGETTDLEAQGVEHEVTYPTPQETTQPLRERIANAMAYWDGDHPAACMKTNVSMSRPTHITIGGGGGEIAHGQYYANAKDLQKISAARRPMDRVAGNAPWQICTGDARASARAFLDGEAKYAARLRRRDPSALDLFYLRQRFRRWVMAGHNTSAVVMFAAPAFVRLAFDLSPEDRISRVAHLLLTRTCVPAWGEIPYYKPEKDDLRQITAQGLRLWQHEESARELYDTIAKGVAWPNYLDRASIESFAELARGGQAENAHEQWFHRVLWIESFTEHLSGLRRLYGAARS